MKREEKRGQNLSARKFLGSDNPITVLKNWLNRAKGAGTSPPVMHLSTEEGGQPFGRMVLLKGFKKNSLIFFSNYQSKKGRHLESNPRSAVIFYWPKQGRQICITGTAKKITRKESRAYWRTRSRESQLSQWMSRQSEPVSSRKALLSLKSSASAKFKGRDIPCPPHWGGYALSIKTVEFWRERPHRLHDRFLFRKTAKGWKAQRLFP